MTADAGTRCIHHEGMPLSSTSLLPTRTPGGSRSRAAIRTTGLVAGLGLVVAFAARSRESLGAERTGDASAARVAPEARHPAAHDTSPDTLPRTWLEMKNVHLRVANDAVVGIRSLRGEVMPTHAGSSALLDSTTSFSIRITSGTVAIESADLSVILNRFVFGYDGSPLRKLRVRTDGTQLVQSGVMRKGVDLKFEITSSLSLTDSGLIRLHPTKVRVLGVNGQSLLRALGLQLDDLLDLSGSKAARVNGNDIYLDPTKILPPPAIAGRLVAVRVEGDALVQEFERLPEDSVFERYARADSVAPNYLFFRGGRLRFGRLEMRDTQLQILDLDPRDPFDLFLAEYNRQLVAGYSRNRPDLSLQAFFPDFTDIESGPVVARR
ncbi:MAG TPA: hypothetical protein VFZ21_19230 [Gemmatimonadaceae bacterium]|nr:hypothetical protein [Gemmatimonadaceae bacterium]